MNKPWIRANELSREYHICIIALDVNLILALDVDADTPYLRNTTIEQLMLECLIGGTGMKGSSKGCLGSP